MVARHLRVARQKAGLSQQQAAVRLGVSQPYYSQLEGGSRQLPKDLAPVVVRKLAVSPSVLPLPDLTSQWTPIAPARTASALAALGYSPFAHFKKGAKQLNPALVVVGALAHSDLEIRIVEALPWVLATFDDLDADWLVAQCRLLNLQNKLGYVATLASQADGAGAAVQLKSLLKEIGKSRLAHEDTLCRESMSQVERAWIRKHRPAEAAHWGLLTTLTADQLNYAA